MISNEFIRHGRSGIKTSAVLMDFLNYVEKSNNVFDELHDKLDAIYETAETNLLFGNDDVNIYVEAATKTKKNIITRFGEFIKGLFDRVVGLIQKVVQSFDKLTYRFRSVDKKMEILLKEHPEYRKEIMYQIEDINKTKSIDELDKAYHSCLSRLMSGEDPGKVKTAWEQALDIFDKAKPAIVAVATVASIATYLSQIRTFLGGNTASRIDKQRRKANAFFTAVDKKAEQIKDAKGIDKEQAKNEVYSSITSKVDVAKMIVTGMETTEVRLHTKVQKGALDIVKKVETFYVNHAKTQEAQTKRANTLQSGANKSVNRLADTQRYHNGGEYM